MLDVMDVVERDDFYYDYGERRDVQEIKNPVEDQKICNFGRKTGAKCDTVYKLSVCKTVDDIEHCRLVAMDDHTTAGGDSGGPWYYGNVAYGIHSSRKTIWFQERSLWSRTKYMDDALDATIIE